MAQSSKAQSQSKFLSMTGFGRGLASLKEVKVEVEARSVNSRFLDLVPKLPKVYSIFENDLRKLAAEYVGRGRLELTVVRSSTEEELFGGQSAAELEKQYYISCSLLKRHLKLTDELKGKLLISLILQKENRRPAESSDSIKNGERAVLLKAAEQALKGLIAMRAREGGKLKADCQAHLARLKSLTAKISHLARLSPAQVRAKLLSRVKALEPEIALDSERLASEVAIMADRIDVSEELVRLESHFDQFLSALKESGSGRRLDFIIQELGREFNTISSKAQDAQVQRLVVDAKAVIEKMKEQVQNVE